MLKQSLLVEDSSFDIIFHALADRSRRAIVRQLSRGPASVSELARPLTISLPAVVQHLHVLEASGLVRSEKVGRVRTCHLQPMVLRAAEQWISDRRTTCQTGPDRPDDHLAAHPGEPIQGSDTGDPS